MVFGDLITEVNGKPVNSTEELAAVIDRHQIGDTIQLTVQQGKAVRGLSVRLDNEE